MKNCGAVTLRQLTVQSWADITKIAPKHSTRSRYLLFATGPRSSLTDCGFMKVSENNVRIAMQKLSRKARYLKQWPENRGNYIKGAVIMIWITGGSQFYSNSKNITKKPTFFWGRFKIGLGNGKDNR